MKNKKKKTPVITSIYNYETGRREVLEIQSFNQDMIDVLRGKIK